MMEKLSQKEPPKAVNKKQGVRLRQEGRWKGAICKKKDVPEAGRVLWEKKGKPRVLKKSRNQPANACSMEVS